MAQKNKSSPKNVTSTIYTKMSTDSSEWIALLDTGNFIHPTFIPKGIPIIDETNTITQSYGQRQTKSIIELNCKILHRKNHQIYRIE